MRLALALTAVAAAVAAVPAAADAPKPVCVVRIVHSDAGGPAASCRAGDAPELSGMITYRVLDVEVAAGVVHATVACSTPWGTNSRSAVFYPSSNRQSVRVVEYDGQECVSTLAALADNTSAVGVSNFSYAFPRTVS